MITDFKIYEAKIRDCIEKTKKSKYESNPDIESYINKNVNRKFEDDSPLLYNVYLEDYDINLKFEYYDTPAHSIKEKIKDRTSLKSVSEFNDVFEKTIKTIIPDKLGIGIDKIDNKGCYALYLIENKFFFLIDIDPNSLIEGYFIDKYGRKTTKKYHSFVVTIHNESTIDRYYKMFDIDDSNF